MQQSTMIQDPTSNQNESEQYLNVGEYLLNIMRGNTVDRNVVLIHAVDNTGQVEKVLTKAEQQAQYYARQLQGTNYDTARHEFATAMLWEYARHIAHMLES